MGTLGRVLLLEEKERQLLDIRPALAQRRQLDRKYVQAMVEVLAQLALGHGLARIAVGRRDDTHIVADLRGAADARELAGLEHAQQLHLQLHRHLGDFVEEDAAAVGALEEALVLPVRAGEAAALVTEELGLDELRRDGAAVQGQKRRIAPTADSSCTVCAASSLPVPLSPIKKTVAEVGATRLSWS